MSRPQPIPTLFPYTTLFRSEDQAKTIPQAERLRIYMERIAAKPQDRKSTRLNSSHEWISYAVFCLKKKSKGPKPLQIKLLTTYIPKTITFTLAFNTSKLMLT